MIWKACAVALACAALLMLPAAAAAAGDRTLERYAAGTWASFVAMTDDEHRAADRPAQRGRDARRADVDDEHRRVHVERGRRAAARPHRPARAGPADGEDADHARAHGALRRQRPVLQLVRPPDGREAHDLAADRRAAHADPLLRRQRVARRRAADRAQHACRSSPRARARCTTRMDFGFYYQPERNQILFHYAPSTGAAPCCYDTIVSESRIAYYVGIEKGDLPADVYYGPVRTFPETCAGSFQETRPDRLHAHATRAAACTRARIRTATRGSCRAGAGACSRR